MPTQWNSNPNRLDAPTPTSTERQSVLEERLRMEESTLSKLLHRNSEIVSDLETARLRLQKLLERKVLLQQRKLHLRAARVKHLSFQQELQDSLTKSRERLARLTSLEQESQNGSVEDGDRLSGGDSSPCQDTEGSSVLNSRVNGNTWDEGSANDAHKPAHSLEEAALPDFDKDEGAALRLGVTASVLPPPINIHSLEGKEEVCGGHVRVDSVVHFLPAVGHDLVETILTMSMREANALDQTADASRRYLLWNTCLDFSLLSSPASAITLEKPAEKSEQKSDSTELDPNIPLCPYELAGVCADTFCPYQHTSRSSLPRERIPLPPLVMEESDSASDGDISRNREKDGNRDVASKRLGQKLEKSSPVFKRDLGTRIDVLETRDHDDGSEEEFLLLPPADPLDTGNDENSASHSENSGCMSDNTSKVALWWGGVLEPDLLPIDKVMENLGMAGVKAMQTQILPIGLHSADSVRTLGCVVDMIRIALHGGRMDLAISLCKHEKESSRQMGFVQDVTRVLNCAIRNQLMVEGKTSGYLRASFNSQSTLAILSEYISSCDQSAQQTNRWPSAVSPLHKAAMECCDALLSPDTDSHWTATTNFSIDEFEFLLFQTGSIEGFEIGEEKHAISVFEALHGSILWTQQSCTPKNGHFSSMLQSDHHSIRRCWFAASRRLRSVQQLYNRRLESLKVVLLMGHVILGCLESIAACVQGDELTLSQSTAFVAINENVSRVLAELSNQLSGDVLTELVLTPVHAASNSATAFLKQYSSAYDRIHSFLGLGSPSQGKTCSLGMFSELVWSQFLLLRMALPADSREDKTLSESDYSRTKSRQYDWELSMQVQNDNNRIAKRIKDVGIQLHHLTLEGDWILSQALCRDPKNSVQSDNLHKVASVVWGLIFSNWEPGHQHTQLPTALQLEGIQFCAFTDDHGRTRSPLLSTLPHAFLLAGHAMKDLQLAGCTLSILPASFGLYFPNLVVRSGQSIFTGLSNWYIAAVFCNRDKTLEALSILTLASLFGLVLPQSLDLSGNQLEQLPLSFRGMIRLEHLMVSHNRLQNISGEELMASLKSLNLSHNALTDATFSDFSVSVGFVATLTRRCFQLEELDLSCNNIENVEMLNNVVIPQWTIQLKHLRMLKVMPQYIPESHFNDSHLNDDGSQLTREHESFTSVLL